MNRSNLAAVLGMAAMLLIPRGGAGGDKDEAKLSPESPNAKQSAAKDSVTKPSAVRQANNDLTDDDRIDRAMASLVAAGKDWRAESAAVKELAAAGEKALSTVRRAAESHDDARVRRACFALLTDALAKHEHAIDTVLNDGLSDADGQIRYLCAFRLGTNKTYQAHRRLRNLMNDSSAEERTRIAAAKSLAELGEAEAIVALYDALGADDYMTRYMGNLGIKTLSGKDLDEFEGYSYSEGAFVSGGVEARMERRGIADAERRAKRFAAIASYCKWLKQARPELYKHLDGGF